MGILTPDMRRVIREQRLGYIATVAADNTPNLSPKGTTTVWDDDHLVFADICSPGTIENLRGNPAIEINVVDPIVRKGYRFKGRAAVLDRGPRFTEVMDFYRNVHKLRPGLAGQVRHIVLVRIERALPLVSPIYDLGQTEEQVAAEYAAYYAALRTKDAAAAARAESSSAKL
jgi:predicted pyridoxine 5'-phosphate oxidase superfamily flavin-nucleotide-binding protein